MKKKLSQAELLARRRLSRKNPNRRPAPPEFGQLVRKLKEGRGMLSVDLALQLGIQPNIVSAIERGVLRPALARIFQLATALKADPKDLLRAAGRCLPCRGTGLREVRLPDPPPRPTRGSRYGEVRRHDLPLPRKPFGKFMEAAREKLGLSQREFADFAGVQKSNISDLESGSGRVNMSIERLRLLASKLGVDLGAALDAADRCRVCEGTGYAA